MSDDLLTITADIVAAHVSNNRVSASDMPQLITSVHQAFAALNTAATAVEVTPLTPAVSIRASVKPDYIVCLEDGHKASMLKRHLMVQHNMTPDEYRTKWGLPADYPMTAPNYSARRRDLAKTNGLGRKPGTKVPSRPKPAKT